MTEVTSVSHYRSKLSNHDEHKLIIFFIQAVQSSPNKMFSMYRTEQDQDHLKQDQLVLFVPSMCLSGYERSSGSTNENCVYSMIIILVM